MARKGRNVGGRKAQAHKGKGGKHRQRVSEVGKFDGHGDHVHNIAGRGL